MNLSKHYREYGCFIGAAAMLALMPITASAQPAAPAPTQKAASPQATAVTPKPAAKKGPPRGPIEKLDCKIGTEDNHARIAVLAQGGDVQSMAYYSKWKPRTCSLHLQRGDAYSKWRDTGDATIVTTEFGDVLMQERKTEYRFIFRDVDRMHYCGMMGKLNGSMTISRGPKRTCMVEGLMDHHESDKEDSTHVELKPKPALPDAPQAALRKP